MLVFTNLKKICFYRIARVPPDGPGWDGTFRGVAMPSSDYWFRYELGEGRSFTGHFTLKR
ncbi:T9SS type B sorting domain-containing protein [Ulvibacterium sp.]|uniref:T9SS type B sorting domain-containing protein n=1 Tax=Ulvibacterium sp. TaxID=2665914 RepID=UPI003BA98988